MIALGDHRIPDRIRLKIFVDPVSSCWLWLGGNSGSGRGGGYGRVSWLGCTTAVHLLMWRLTGGRLLRPGEQLDHQCRVRHCCNPAHLKPMYQPKNIQLAYKRRAA